MHFCRPKRSLAEFQSELESCGSGRCTIIKCTIGPLEKDESVLFKVRSRLFTETQVKVSDPSLAEHNNNILVCAELC